MSKYRKKPVVIEAYQVTHDLINSVEIGGGNYPLGLRLVHCGVDGEKVNNWKGSVTTIHGQKTDVVINDWILPEPQEGRFYPCKPDIFEITYEAVNDEQQ